MKNQTINVEKLIDTFRTKAEQDGSKHVDWALFSLLEHTKESIRGTLRDTPYSFHKSLRIGEGMDLYAMWNLIHCSQIFWDVFNSVLEERQGN